MGCGCNAPKTSTQTVTPQIMSDTSGVDCPYTKEQCATWLIRVQCVKDNGHYLQFGMTVYDINLYIGVLLSVQNYAGSPCYFRAELQEIESFITVLTANNICPTP